MPSFTTFLIDNLFSFLSKTGKYYKLLSGPYVLFDEADKKCKDLGARLPVLDSQDTIDVIRNYMKNNVSYAMEFLTWWVLKSKVFA